MEVFIIKHSLKGILKLIQTLVASNISQRLKNYGPGFASLDIASEITAQWFTSKGAPSANKQHNIIKEVCESETLCIIYVT